MNFTRLKFVASLIVFCIMSAFQGLSQDYWKSSFKSADEIALKTKKNPNIQALSRNLTSALPDTIDKYRAIFTWIANNISYDVNGLENDKSVKTDPKGVISSGKSVCEGFANLFDALCKASGLRSISISGWTKNTPDKIGRNFPKYTTHAWNAITVNNRWFLCDVTWASGTISEETQKFEKHFNDFYFCMPEHLFFLSHFPEDKNWLLGQSISETEFINGPFFFGPALEANIKDLQPQAGTLKFKRGETFTFNFSIDRPVNHILVKTSSQKTAVQVPFSIKKNKISFKYTLDHFDNFLYIFFDNMGAIVYRIERQ